MAKTNERVMAMVRRELTRNPNLSSSDLYERAKRFDRSVRLLSLRQFHALYPLQVKRTKALNRRRRGGRKAAKKTRAGRKRAVRGARKKAAPKNGRRKRRKRAVAKRGPSKRATRGRRPRTAAPAAAGSTSARDGVQTVLLQFAAAVADADKTDMVKLMLGMDGWVDRVMDATR